MSTDLYRKDAFHSKIKGFSNPVTIRGSLSATLMMVGLLLLLVGLVLYGWFNPYTRKVTAPGFVAPQSGSIEVESPSAGVARIDVANGAAVAKGEVLAVVTDTLAGEADESDIALQLEALREKRDLMDQRIAFTERRRESVKTTYRLKIENAERQRTTNERILAMQRDKNALAENANQRTEKLVAQGLSTAGDLERTNTELIAANQSVVDAETALLEAEEAIKQAEIDRELELNSLREELIGYRSERLNMSNEIARLENEREREIVAPRGGIVTFSQARNFERVAQGEPLFTIDPRDEDYVATILAPSSAIGFVKTGDTVSIRYEAYPYREHGVFSGEVTAIDNTAQLPQAIAAPIGGQQPVYRLHAEIDQHPVNKAGNELRLVSGMLFEASIVVDEKPILFWLLNPVL